MSNYNGNDVRYSILVDRETYLEFEKARARLSLSTITYLRNLMGKDFTVMVKFKHIDLHQTRLYDAKEADIGRIE